MKNKINRVTISGAESKYFRGEMMICHKCGKQQRSNIKKESQWTVVEVDGRPLYYCPVCFGNARYMR